jgi:phage tail sheath protein FI
MPPDGLVCGMIAARELARGAWVAPANQPLRGPTALTPAIAAGDLPGLFNAHANLLVHEPGVFTTLSAHTLADDPAQLQISVRRLLILLRKIALQQGQHDVFEVNNDRFRQFVQMRFTRILGELAQGGAFPAYQVVTDGGVNTPGDIDNGRLIISLQIAPSNPVEFITVSLVRSGEGLLDVLEG